MRPKSEVRPGDRIHIYIMFGEHEYSGAEGVVTHIDDANQIHGTWGGCALFYDDDWEILED